MNKSEETSVRPCEFLKTQLQSKHVFACKINSVESEEKIKSSSTHTQYTKKLNICSILRILNYNLAQYKKNKVDMLSY